MQQVNKAPVRADGFQHGLQRLHAGVHVARIGGLRKCGQLYRLDLRDLEPAAVLSEQHGAADAHGFHEEKPAEIFLGSSVLHGKLAPDCAHGARNGDFRLLRVVHEDAAEGIEGGLIGFIKRRHGFAVAFGGAFDGQGHSDVSFRVFWRAVRLRPHETGRSARFLAFRVFSFRGFFPFSSSSVR